MKFKYTVKLLEQTDGEVRWRVIESPPPEVSRSRSKYTVKVCESDEEGPASFWDCSCSAFRAVEDEPNGLECKHIRMIKRMAEYMEVAATIRVCVDDAEALTLSNNFVCHDCAQVLHNEYVPNVGLIIPAHDCVNYCGEWYERKREVANYRLVSHRVCERRAQVPTIVSMESTAQGRKGFFAVASEVANYPTTARLVQPVKRAISIRREVKGGRHRPI